VLARTTKEHHIYRYTLWGESLDNDELKRMLPDAPSQLRPESSQLDDLVLSSSKPTGRSLSNMALEVLQELEAIRTTLYQSPRPASPRGADVGGHKARQGAGPTTQPSANLHGYRASPGQQLLLPRWYVNFLGRHLDVNDIMRLRNPEAVQALFAWSYSLALMGRSRSTLGWLSQRQIVVTLLRSLDRSAWRLANYPFRVT